MANLSSTHAAWTPRVLSILRIAAAFMFLAHGAQKLFGFLAPPGSPSPAMFSQIWVGGVIELFGGLLLLLGLFTRPVAFVLSGEAAFAYFIGHAPRNFFPALNGGDAAILYCFMFLYLAAAGPGPWSLDAARERRGGPLATPDPLTPGTR